MPPVRASGQRLLSAVVLLAWTVPAAGALGLSLHVALDHHAAHGGRCTSELSDLLRAAVHGHHHDTDAAPVHEHDVSVEAPAPAVRSVPLAAAVPAPSASPPPSRAARPLRPDSPRRAPPGPLFAAHCSLLL